MISKASGETGRADHWVPAYIGLGSNLDEPQQQVARGFEALEQLPSTRLIQRSSLYRSSPLGPQDQPDFINAVAGLLTQLDPYALLAALKEIEHRLGRKPTQVHWGPRIIDLDLLVYGSARIDEPQLHVPHAGIQSRNFVLYPLAQIAPQLLVPGIGRVSRLLAQLDVAEIVRL
jgi:2-amino-4-hydroxy-6-hydroxymethyldihydropteridine diphosphokinase